MAFYAVGMMTIVDAVLYRRYEAAFLPVLQRYSGRLLVADEEPEVVDGPWPHGKLIILEFEDEGSFRRFNESAEYREIREDRVAGAAGVVVAGRGVR